jgi:hypothetical protein
MKGPRDNKTLSAKNIVCVLFDDFQEAGGPVSPWKSVQAVSKPYRNPYRDFVIQPRGKDQTKPVSPTTTRAPVTADNSNERPLPFPNNVREAQLSL